MASSRKKKRASRKVQIVSVVLHAVALGAVAAISTGNVPAPIAVMMAEVVPPSRVPEAPPRPPVAAPTPAPQPRQPRAARPTPQQAPQAAEAASGDATPPPDFGIAFEGLANGGTGGIYVPQGDPSGVRGDGTNHAAPRVLTSNEETHQGGSHGCQEDDVPARQRRLPRVTFSNEALAAHVEGNVRMSVDLDDEGRVLGVRVTRSLGYGLDENAVSAVRNGTFEPAKRCGRSIASTVPVEVHFRR